MEQETPSTSPATPPLGDLQAPTDALKMLIGGLVVDGIVKDHAIAQLQRQVLELTVSKPA